MGQGFGKSILKVFFPFFFVNNQLILQEIKKLDFPSIPNSLEVSKDGTVLTVTYSNHVTFLDSDSLGKIREFSVPTTVNSASLHPDKTIFVAGGDDLKVYKFDYTTGNEIGTLFYWFNSIQ